MEENREPIIKIENLAVVYDPGKSNENRALKDINLEIYPEEYVIFFGPSGCGKSTLLYIIAGLEKPSQGKVIVNGKNLTSLSEKELIEFHRSSLGMVFQAYYLVPSLTARDNVILPQVFMEKSPVERLEKAKILMERFGITDFQKRTPTKMSGGQQQRVAIARSLINDPPILLADEPVGNLDSKNAEIVIDLLAELNSKDKKTVLHVTHDPSYLSHAHRIFYMRDGKITRVVSNPKKQVSLLHKIKISELEKLIQIYPYLSESQLKAKVILNNLLIPYSIDIQQKIEDAIGLYLSRKLGAREMLEIFDKPAEEGGLSLYTQTAQNLVEKIISIAKEGDLMESKEGLEAAEFVAAFNPEEKAKELCQFLLDEYGGKLSYLQTKKLETFLGQRIQKDITEKELEGLLDLPFKEGGVGLNKRTAEDFVRKIELILMKK